MSEFSGRYIIDIPSSAKLRTGWFTDRFAMKPGYFEEVEALFQANADSICDLTMQIDERSLKLCSEDGEEAYPIIVLPPGRSGQLVVDWDGIEVTFNVVDLEDGALHFQSEENELGSWEWRKELSRLDSSK
jgi:hypothetical protein